MLRRIVLQSLLSALPVLAVLALILSLAALGARMVLPRMAGQRAQIEDYLGRFLGRPVTVESVRAAWDGWDPRLVLTGLSVLNGKTLRPAMRFQRAVIGIDVWASLGRRQLQLGGSRSAAPSLPSHARAAGRLSSKELRARTRACCAGC